jgi:hypothetical protein
MTDYEELVIPKWAVIGVSLAILVLVTLGYIFSPREIDGRPILLLPDVKAVGEYQSAIMRWQTQAKDLDLQISTVLSGVYGEDIFARSREAQKMIDDAVWLIQSIERQKTPTAAVPARSLSMSMASAYLEAARATLVWTTAPTEHNLNNAQQQLEIARQALRELEASEWTTTR